MIAGMIDKVVLATVNTAKHLATQRRGAAIEDCLHRPAMRGKNRGAKLPFILRPILAQHLGQRDHRGEPLSFEILVELGEGGLGARFADRGQMRVDDGGVQSVVPEVEANLAQ